MRLKITSARFERSLYAAPDEPRAGGPVVVFLGRSNVGKSSLVNRLLGTPGLARTSSTPGRTRCVNLYLVNEAIRFADLPGYGYAAVSKEERRAWRPLAEGYLERNRGRIVLAVLVVDARREPTALDLTMRDWLRERSLPFVVAATKSDKLSGGLRARAARALAPALAGPPGEGPCVLVSSTTGLGIRELWTRLDRALGAGGGRVEGEAWTSAS